MSEFSPAGGTPPRMTKAQMRKWLADMKAAQEAAQKRLEEEAGNEENEKHIAIKKLEEKLDDAFLS